MRRAQFFDCSTREVFEITETINFLGRSQRVRILVIPDSDGRRFPVDTPEIQIGTELLMNRCVLEIDFTKRSVFISPSQPEPK